MLLWLALPEEIQLRVADPHGIVILEEMMTEIIAKGEALDDTVNVSWLRAWGQLRLVSRAFATAGERLVIRLLTFQDMFRWSLSSRLYAITGRVGAFRETRLKRRDLLASKNHKRGQPSAASWRAIMGSLDRGPLRAPAPAAWITQPRAYLYLDGHVIPGSVLSKDGACRQL